MRVKLYEVVDRITGNVDRFNTDLLYYLGGEHYQSNQIAIYDKGLLKSENGAKLGFKFHFPFIAGDTIFMSRNPHLRKAGMVTYDGLCSDTSYILRTKDPEVLDPKYLPLVIQNDLFWDFFEANKSGSVNYLLNWKEMKNYEFELPSIDEQRRIVDLVWAAEDCRRKYITLQEKTDDVVRAKFAEMFVGKNYPRKTLQELSKSWQKGQAFQKSDLNVDGENQCIHYGELFTKYGIYIDDVYSRTNASPIKTSEMGDILFPASDVTPIGLTKCSAILVNNVILGGDIILMRPETTNNPVYLSYAIRMEKEQLLNRVTGSVVRHLSAKGLQTVSIIVPPIEEQDKFESLVRESNKSIQELSQACTNIENVIRSILNEMVR